MNRPRNHLRTAPARAGFTLLEILLATVMFILIMGSIYGALNVAMRLQKATEEQVARGEAERAFVALMRQDLECMVRPNGVMAAAVIGTRMDGLGGRADSIEFPTATGVITDSEPWGDLQVVRYALEGADSETLTPTRSSSSVRRLSTASQTGSTLIRTVQRNLTATEIVEEPPQEALLENVASFMLQYYDGRDWQEEWDSTAYYNGAPRAVRVRVEFAPPENGAQPTPPIDLVVPIPVSDQDTIDGLNVEEGAVPADGGATGGGTGGGTTGGGATGGGAGGGATGGGTTGGGARGGGARGGGGA